MTTSRELRLKRFIKNEFNKSGMLPRFVKDTSGGLAAAEYAVGALDFGKEMSAEVSGRAEAKGTADFLRGEITSMKEARSKATGLIKVIDKFLDTRGTIDWVGLAPVSAYKDDLQKTIKQIDECTAEHKSIIEQLPEHGDAGAYGKYDKRAEASSKQSLHLIRHEARVHSQCYEAFERALEKKAIRTYLQMAKSKGKDRLEMTEKILHETSALAQLFIPPGWKWAGATADLILALGQRGANEALLAAQGADYEKNNIKGSIYREHNKDPMTFAAGIYEDHKANLKHLLAAVNIGLVEMPWWPYVSTALSTIIDKAFEQKLELGKIELAIKNKEIPEQRDSILKNVRETVIDSIKDTVTSPANWLGATGVGPDDKSSGTKKGGSANWADFAQSTAINLFIQSFVTLVIKSLPLEPAEGFSGDEMIAELRTAAETVLGEAHRILGDFEFPARELPPDEDADGNPVTSVLSGLLPDRDRQFWWVIVDGKTGALYSDDNTFVPAGEGTPTPSAGVSHFLARPGLVPPTKTGWKTLYPVEEVDLAKSELEYDFQWDFWVRIVVDGKSLWGYADAHPDREWAVFTAKQPDVTAFSKWGARFIEFNGYREDGPDGDLVEGTWHRPGGAMSSGVLLFLAKDGSHEWAHLIDHAKNSQSDKGTLEELLRVNKNPLPDYDMRDLLG